MDGGRHEFAWGFCGRCGAQAAPESSAGTAPQTTPVFALAGLAIVLAFLVFGAISFVGGRAGDKFDSVAESLDSSPSEDSAAVSESTDTYEDDGPIDAELAQEIVDGICSMHEQGLSRSDLVDFVRAWASGRGNTTAYANAPHIIDLSLANC